MFIIRHQIIALCCLFVFFGCGLPKIVTPNDPLTPEEHINLGLSYEKRNEFDPAIKQYELAAESLPAAYLYLGNIYFKQENFNKAEDNYKKAIKKDPKNADAYNNLAWLYYKKNENLDKAQKLVMEAIKINPSKESIYTDTLNKIRRSL
jgi:tetratricopeptide (TPR) repeat protein